VAPAVDDRVGVPDSVNKVGVIVAVALLEAVADLVAVKLGVTVDVCDKVLAPVLVFVRVTVPV